MFTHSFARFVSLLAIISLVLAVPIPKGHGSSSDSNSKKNQGNNSDSTSDSSSSSNLNSSASSSTSGASFAADPSIDVTAILKAVQAATSKPVSGGKFGTGHGKDAQIYQLDAGGSSSSVFAFTADMDVDCDGTDYQCKGNGDGQKETSYGALSAKRVPFYVIPQSFVDKEKIKENSLGAIICNNKMYYAIMGDTNGDSPEVIGEASWLMAQTCFPNDGLDGAKGHDTSDVTYISFVSLVSSGIDEKSPTIDLNTLKSLAIRQ
ncbi:glycoside hydrolase family 75 protein [Collybiopsis luxurians FD-317 M1]|uniref:Endo-chitosanase n=1 Tax=Collybiopsis luxurians FD-317 M1 TaxID=944289 RepID=A0A0D0BSN3_9AGAR|nr:glycoside hydrolase family 75 protein [Collybiopsis luxurians FD-317 M1]